MRRSVDDVRFVVGRHGRVVHVVHDFGSGLRMVIWLLVISGLWWRMVDDHGGRVVADFFLVVGRLCRLVLHLGRVV